MKFEAKKKSMEVTINGEAYKMAYPSMGDYEELQEAVKKADPMETMKVYFSFFEKLGLPIVAQKKMDTDDFMSFINFALTPKKNSQAGQ
jgi:hypothetical protein